MSKLIFPFLGISIIAFAAENDRCVPEPPACCCPDECNRCYCLGPDNIIANAPVCPVTCCGDFRIEVAGMYWQATQDGMEYAIDNRVRAPDNSETNGALLLSSIQELNNLIDAKYEEPNFKWDWGFKIGLSYCMTCDGWDVGIYWTRFRGKASSHIEAESDDNHTLLPLWSAFASTLGSLNYCSDIKTSWKAHFDLIDIELGRDFWVSHCVAIRPHVGLRIAFIDQEYEIEHKGGSYGPFVASTNLQDPFNNDVDLKNDYKGIGVRGGLDSTWHLGCGWSLFGEIAASIIYGRFDISHDEDNRLADSDHTKTNIAEIKESCRVSRAILDMALGVQWGTLFCDCKYGFNIALSWEQHTFFHQNQLWRITRVTDLPVTSLPNNTGENDFGQRRGTLNTQGATLKVEIAF